MNDLNPQESPAAGPPPAKSPWSPLHNALFRSLWIATIVSNIGTWMQDVGAGWLMTSLSSSPSMVALVEAADSFPVMLLALPAGALADIVDRRRLLIGIQVYLMLVAGALAVLTLLGLMTPWVLLGFIVRAGRRRGLMMPAWAAIVPDLVPADEMPAAVALNSIAINVSRAIGPAIAGVAGGGGRPVAGVRAERAVVHRHPRGAAAVAARAPQEHAAGRALPERHSRRHALRHAHAGAANRAHPRQRLFRVRQPRRGRCFRSSCGSELGRGPEIYGLLLTCIGVGAVAGAVLLPRIRAKVSRDIAGRGRQRALRAGRARARACAEHRAAGGGDARDRRRVDIDPFGAAGLGADDAAGVGARTRTCRVRRHLHGRHGARQHPVGSGRDAHRHSGGAHDGRSRHGGRDRVDVAIQARASTKSSTSRRRWIGPRRCSRRRPSPTADRSW